MIRKIIEYKNVNKNNYNKYEILRMMNMMKAKIKVRIIKTNQIEIMKIDKDYKMHKINKEIKNKDNE